MPYDGAVLPLPTPVTPDAGTAPPPVDAGLPAYPPCSAQPNPIYATGSTALTTLLSAVGASLAGDITFVYQGSGSCVGVTAVLDSAYVMTGTAVYYTGSPSTPTSNTCALPAGGVPADIGIADVFAGTCESLPNGLPNNIQENFGPVQVMTFAVPATSNQTSISKDAAYYVFGFGSQSMVSPWTNASYIFQRTPSSGTQNMIGAAIGVPPTLWQGVTHASTGAMLTALQNAGKADGGVPDEAIGILVAGSAAENRATIRELAYEDVGQSCGYYPDSTSTAFDLQNARDGHYPICGPVALLYARQQRHADQPERADVRPGSVRSHAAARRRPDRALRLEGGERRPAVRDARHAHERRRRLQPVHADRVVQLLLRCPGDRADLVQGVQHFGRLPGERPQVQHLRHADDGLLRARVAVRAQELSKIASERPEAREAGRHMLQHFEAGRPTHRVVQPQYWTAPQRRDRRVLGARSAPRRLRRSRSFMSSIAGTIDPDRTRRNTHSGRLIENVRKTGCRPGMKTTR